MNPLTIITLAFSTLVFTSPTPPGEGLGGRRAPSGDTQVNRPGGLLGGAGADGVFPADSGNPDTNPDTKAPKFIRTPINKDQVNEYSDLLRQVLIDAKALKEVKALVSQWDNATTMDKKSVLDLIQGQQELASKEIKVKSIRFVLDENYDEFAKGVRIKDGRDALKKKYDDLLKMYDDLRHHR
jgi:hypothetical protein